jgi:hypothetical protein
LWYKKYENLNESKFYVLHFAKVTKNASNPK